MINKLRLMVLAMILILKYVLMSVWHRLRSMMER